MGKKSQIQAELEKQEISFTGHTAKADTWAARMLSEN